MIKSRLAILRIKKGIKITNNKTTQTNKFHNKLNIQHRNKHNQKFTFLLIKRFIKIYIQMLLYFNWFLISMDLNNNHLLFKYTLKYRKAKLTNIYDLRKLLEAHKNTKRLICKKLQ